MAQIKVKQISDFITASESVNTAGNLPLNASVNSIETVLAGVATGGAVTDLQGSVNSLETQVSTESSTRTSADTSLTTRVSTEESTRASADTSLTTRVSTEESTRTSADTSLTTRVSTEESTRTSADTSLTTRVSGAESVNVVQSTAISSLEVAILEDYEMLVEEKTGIVAAALAPTVYTLLFSVQDNNEKLVEVFVNGVKAKCTVASGVSVTLVADYAIDATDVVTFVYQKD